MKAVFFDRDGVLNRELGKYVEHHTEFELNDWVIPFMTVFKNAGYNFFVITNQGGIAKGLYTHTDLFAIHQKLASLLHPHYLHFAEIYYCPHHPLQTLCLCRKPGSLMLEKAIAKYGVDTSKSFMLGDSDRDVEAAKAIGLSVFKVLPNHPPDADQVKEIETITGVTVLP